MRHVAHSGTPLESAEHEQVDEHQKHLMRRIHPAQPAAKLKTGSAGAAVQIDDGGRLLPHEKAPLMRHSTHRSSPHDLRHVMSASATHPAKLAAPSNPGAADPVDGDGESKKHNDVPLMRHPARKKSLLEFDGLMRRARDSTWSAVTNAWSAVAGTFVAVSLIIICAVFMGTFVFRIVYERAEREAQAQAVLLAEDSSSDSTSADDARENDGKRKKKVKFIKDAAVEEY